MHFVDIYMKNHGGSPSQQKRISHIEEDLSRRSSSHSPRSKNTRGKAGGGFMLDDWNDGDDNSVGIYVCIYI
jgi:hypothetical protein